MKSLFSSGIIKSKPNIFIYTAVINACAYTERDSIEQRDGLRIFVSMYKEMISDDSVVPNHVTFITVLTALKNLLPADEKRANASYGYPSYGYVPQTGIQPTGMF